MTVSDNLRELRAELRLSQEEMAQEIGMSKNGYQKLENKGNNISYERILNIAEILNVDINRLTKGKEPVNIMVGDNNNNYQNQYSTVEIEKLQLIITHKDEIIAQKDKEIELLRKLLDKA